MTPLQSHAHRANQALRFTAIFSGFLLAATLAATLSTSDANASPSSLIASHSAPPAGLSVEPKEAPFNKGFDFKFKSDTSTTELTIDPLGNKHNASGSISSKAGTISLTGKYSPNDRQITIVAKRGGQEIGEFTWRVEAVLR
ncbi:MAG: hypothetical protein RL591_817 [Planctomycetota bacterium]